MKERAAVGPLNTHTGLKHTNTHSAPSLLTNPSLETIEAVDWLKESLRLFVI